MCCHFQIDEWKNRILQNIFGSGYWTEQTRVRFVDKWWSFNLTYERTHLHKIEQKNYFSFIVLSGVGIWEKAFLPFFLRLYERQKQSNIFLMFAHFQTKIPEKNENSFLPVCSYTCTSPPGYFFYFLRFRQRFRYICVSIRCENEMNKYCSDKYLHNMVYLTYFYPPYQSFHYNV